MFPLASLSAGGVSARTVPGDVVGPCLGLEDTPWRRAKGCPPREELHMPITDRVEGGVLVVGLCWVGIWNWAVEFVPCRLKDGVAHVRGGAEIAGIEVDVLELA